MLLHLVLLLSEIGTVILHFSVSRYFPDFFRAVFGGISNNQLLRNRLEISLIYKSILVENLLSCRFKFSA